MSEKALGMFQMLCQPCDGYGRRRVTFLFWTWTRKCKQCQGTGRIRVNSSAEAAESPQKRKTQLVLVHHEMQSAHRKRAIAEVDQMNAPYRNEENSRRKKADLPVMPVPHPVTLDSYIRDTAPFNEERFN